MFLKIVRAHESPQDPLAWIREVRAYQSGLLTELPGNLAAPRCFDVTEKEDNEFWIWLENVEDEIGPRWPVERYGLAARHLGQFNGAYLTEQVIPSYPWLSKSWLRNYLSLYGSYMERLQESSLPLLTRRACPPVVREAYTMLWAERELLLGALDRLPQVWCHMDAVRPNLVARTDERGIAQTIVIDWSYTGIGAVGEELGPLLSCSLIDKDVPLDRAERIIELAIEGYLQGLCDGGWAGDPDLVQIGYSVALWLRYAPMWLHAAFDWDAMNEEQQAQVEEYYGISLQDAADRLAEVGQIMNRIAGRARPLARALLS